MKVLLKDLIRGDSPFFTFEYIDAKNLAEPKTDEGDEHLKIFYNWHAIDGLRAVYSRDGGNLLSAAFTGISNIHGAQAHSNFSHKGPKIPNTPEIYKDKYAALIKKIYDSIENPVMPVGKFLFTLSDSEQESGTLEKLSLSCRAIGKIVLRVGKDDDVVYLYPMNGPCIRVYNSSTDIYDTLKARDFSIEFDL